MQKQFKKKKEPASIHLIDKNKRIEIPTGRMVKYR